MPLKYLLGFYYEGLADSYILSAEQSGNSEPSGNGASGGSGVYGPPSGGSETALAGLIAGSEVSNDSDSPSSYKTNPSLPSTLPPSYEGNAGANDRYGNGTGLDESDLERYIPIPAVYPSINIEGSQSGSLIRSLPLHNDLAYLSRSTVLANSTSTQLPENLASNVPLPNSYSEGAIDDYDKKD
jgi:hypothetical protein